MPSNDLDGHDDNPTRYNLRHGASPYRRNAVDNTSASSYVLPCNPTTVASRRARPWPDS